MRSRFADGGGEGAGGGDTVWNLDGTVACTVAGAVGGPKRGGERELLVSRTLEGVLADA